MIEVSQDTRGNFCNACIRGDNNCKNIRFGTPNFATVITLCEDCRNELIKQLDINVKRVHKKATIIPPDEDDFLYVKFGDDEND